MKEYYDVIIVGTGAAGLYCALNLPERKRILLITKQEADQSDSFLAQVPEVAGRCVDHHGMCSDCIIGKGYVTKKYVNEKGEHLIDMICWAENWPGGGIAQVIAATVVLPSKG